MKTKSSWSDMVDPLSKSSDWESGFSCSLDLLKHLVVVYKLFFVNALFGLSYMQKSICV